MDDEFTSRQNRAASSCQVSRQDQGMKLFAFVRKHFSTVIPSKRQCRHAFMQGQIKLVNNQDLQGTALETYLVQMNDEIQVNRTSEEAKKEAAQLDQFQVVHKDNTMAVVVKPCGVTPFLQDVIPLLCLDFQLVNPVMVDKSMQGFVLGVKGTKEPKNIVYTFVALCHHHAGKTLGIEPGESIELTEHIKCTFIQATHTRNTRSGWLSRVMLEPRHLVPRSHIKLCMKHHGLPIIGQSTHCIPLKSAKDRGVYLQHSRVSFQHPCTLEQYTFTLEEAAKFKKLELKECMFWTRKRQEEESLLQTSQGLDDCQAAYIQNKAMFFGLGWYINSHVMIPRPASETLIQACLEHFQDRQDTLNILDLGTGSGCLLLSLLYSYPQAKGIGIDISTKALDIAKENAQHLKLNHRAKFIPGCFSSFSSLEGLSDTCFDIIISNPPYLTEKMCRGFEAKVIEQEPSLALLSGGQTGLEMYEKIKQGFNQRLLKIGGIIVLEIAHGMSSAVGHVFQDWVLLKQKRDQKGLERCLVYNQV